MKRFCPSRDRVLSAGAEAGRPPQGCSQIVLGAGPWPRCPRAPSNEAFHQVCQDGIWGQTLGIIDSLSPPVRTAGFILVPLLLEPSAVLLPGGYCESLTSTEWPRTPQGSAPHLCWPQTGPALSACTTDLPACDESPVLWFTQVLLQLWISQGLLDASFFLIVPAVVSTCR